MNELERPVVEASQFHLLVAEAGRNRVLAGVVRPFFRLAFELGPQLYQTTEGYAHWELEQHTRSGAPSPRATASWPGSGCWST